MKLIQHLKYCKLITESCAPGSLFRIMNITELENIVELRGLKLSNSAAEIADIDDNAIKNTKKDADKLRKSEVYKRNKEYPYFKCFARSIAPNLLRNFYDSTDSVIVEFNKEALSNLRNTKIVPIDYQPYGKAHRRTRELEDRLYSKKEILDFPGGKIPEKFKNPAIGKRKNRLARAIKTIYFSEKLAKEYIMGISALKRIGVTVKIIPNTLLSPDPKEYDKFTLRDLNRLEEV